MGALRIGRIDRLIFDLFCLWLLVDSINGFLLRNEIPIPVSQVYKLLVALIVIFRCCNYGTVKTLLVVMLLYLPLYIANVAWNGEEVGESVVRVSKLLTSILFLLYFRLISKSNPDFLFRNAINVFKFNYIIFMGNILLGLAGIGYNSYTDNDGFGYCGFFYAPNELSGVVAALYPWAFFYFKIKYNRLIYLLSTVAMFSVSFLLGTKAGIIVALLSFILITYLYGNRNERRLILILTISMLVAGIVSIQVLLSLDSPIIQRFSWFVDQNGIWGALTSNRLDHWDEKKTDLFSAGPLAMLLGLGGNSTVEMDIFDALLCMGLLGEVLLFLFYLKGLTRPLKNKKNNPYSKVIFSSNLLLVLTSIIAGHVMFSSMAGMLIALSNAMLCKEYEHVKVRRVIYCANGVA